EGHSSLTRLSGLGRRSVPCLGHGRVPSGRPGRSGVLTGLGRDLRAQLSGLQGLLDLSIPVGLASEAGAHQVLRLLLLDIVGLSPLEDAVPKLRVDSCSNLHALFPLITRVAVNVNRGVAVGGSGSSLIPPSPSTL